MKTPQGEIVDYLYNTHFRDGSLGADIPIRHLAETFNVTNLIVSQVNPFVLPYQDRADRRKTSYVVFVLQRLREKVKNFFLSEIKHNLNVLSEIGILPYSLQQLIGLSQQNYHGNVTILPDPKPREYLNILHLPQSDEQMHYFRDTGLRATYHKIYQVKMSMIFENLLEETYQNVQKFYISGEQKNSVDERKSIDLDKLEKLRTRRQSVLFSKLDEEKILNHHQQWYKQLGPKKMKQIKTIDEMNRKFMEPSRKK